MSPVDRALRSSCLPSSTLQHRTLPPPPSLTSFPPPSPHPPLRPSVYPMADPEWVPTVQDLRASAVRLTISSVTDYVPQVKLCYICREEEKYDGASPSCRRDSCRSYSPPMPPIYLFLRPRRPSPPVDASLFLHPYRP